MSVIGGLRSWWQRQTGEEETPFDGDSPAFFVSLVVHLGVMLALAFVYDEHKKEQVTLLITTPPVEEQIDELQLPKEVYFNEEPSTQVGANSENGSEMALSLAPNISSEVSDVPSPVETDPSPVGEIAINNRIIEPVGLNFHKNLIVKGASGVGETGASGAVDRITQEILLSLQERKTLVVWLFDSTASLQPQRKTINERFKRIYEELGVLQASGSESFSKHDDKPLLTSVVSFGDKVHLHTKQPTDNLSEIQKAVGEISDDSTGLERVFSAVYTAAKQYHLLRIPDEKFDGKPERNVMLIAFTDEAGSDQDGLEATTTYCRRYQMPVYVVGVPAPFGRKQTLLKYVHPDPKFDQAPQWGEVEQGPESLVPERIKLGFSGGKDDEEPIDSGFGPYALTRLCYETGGIYFAVHPNRNVNRVVSRGETAEYSAHIKYFFDPEVMRKYRPDYVAQDEYKRRINSNKCRLALVDAASRSSMNQMDSPTLRFVKRSEPELVAALTEAQKDAAKVEPKIDVLFNSLKLGEADREKENVLRWQAGYDLAMGRVMAVKVRTESYNAMLAQAKRGLKFKDEKNNTWILKPADTITVGSALEKMAEKATMYLNRVVTDHPNTPWAMLAKKELDDKLGWEWTEEFTETNPARMGMGGNNNNNPANDVRKMMEKPKPKAPLPKL